MKWRGSAVRKSNARLTLSGMALLSRPFCGQHPSATMSRLLLLSVGLWAVMMSCQTVVAGTNGIAAVVNGTPITQSEVADAVAAQRQMILYKYRENPALAQGELAELERTALTQLIDRELILAEFKKVGGTIKSQYVDDDINTLIREQFKGNRDAFVLELAKSGMTMKKFRDLREKMIIMQVMRGKHGGNQAPPTPGEVKEYYSQHAALWRGKDMIKISTITIPKFSSDPNATPEKQKQLAEEIRSKVIAGNDFAAMAKTYSQDSRAENGGEWDWMDTKLLNPIMRDPAIETKNGGVTPVIEDVAAYVIVYVEAKKLGDMPPLDQVRGDIEKMIKAERGKNDVEKWIEGLRKKAVIRRFS